MVVDNMMDTIARDNLMLDSATAVRETTVGTLAATPTGNEHDGRLHSRHRSRHHKRHPGSGRAAVYRAKYSAGGMTMLIKYR